MERILRETRPSALLSVCVPTAIAPAAQAYALGHKAVLAELSMTLAPIAGFTGSINSKINNCMSSTSANGEGMTASIIRDQISAMRGHSVQIVKVKGGNARGIPPRGVPV